MSDNLEARIEALEAEVKRLRELVESIEIEDVSGDVSFNFGAAVDSLTVYTGDVEGDVSMGLAAGANGLTVHTGDVQGDIGFGITGTANGIEVNAGDVSGDVNCAGGQVTRGE